MVRQLLQQQKNRGSQQQRLVGGWEGDDQLVALHKVCHLRTCHGRSSKASKAVNRAAEAVGAETAGHPHHLSVTLAGAADSCSRLDQSDVACAAVNHGLLAMPDDGASVVDSTGLVVVHKGADQSECRASLCSDKKLL